MPHTIFRFYFLGLTVITGLNLVYRAATIALPPFRSLLLKREGHLFTQDIRYMSAMKYPEWFILSLVGHNIDSKSFTNLIMEYKEELTPRPSFVMHGDKIHRTDYPTMQMGAGVEKEK